ncbi:putative cell surface domain protein, partial [Escherichia coli 10.0869]
MFQELPVKFCAGATFITGFNGSGYSDCTFFLYCLFVRKRAARTVLTGMCYSVGSATRQGSSS